MHIRAENWLLKKMPPNRRKKAKKYGNTKRVANDVVLETDDKPVKKVFKRFKSASAARQNLRSSDKLSATETIDNKHMDMERKNSSSPESKNKSPATNLVDSEEVNSFPFFF